MDVQATRRRCWNRSFPDDHVPRPRPAVAEPLPGSCKSYPLVDQFPPARSREITRALLRAGKRVSYCTIRAQQGHDAFLMPVPQYLAVLGAYTDRVLSEV